MSTYSRLYVHIVFATKDRRPIIRDEWRSDLHAYLGGTVRGLDATPIAVGGVADHVHLLTGIKPTVAVSDFVREIKKASSGWSCKLASDFSWQSGYGAFSIGRTELAMVGKYVLSQEEHHKTLSSADELRALLAEFEIDFDEKYFI